MPRGKKNGAANGAGADAPGPGDNAKAEPTAAMIAEAAREIMEAQSDVASAMASLNAVYNRHEAQGIDKAAIKATVKDLCKTQEQIAAETRTRIRYGVAAGSMKLADTEWTKSVWQAGLDLTPAAGDVADNLRHQQAKVQGMAAGKKGHALDSNPYSARPGSVEFVGWRDGHGEGLRLRAILKPDGDKKRGRPPKAAAAAAPEDTRTQLEKDEDAYRVKGTAHLHDAPVSDMPADPVLN